MPQERSASARVIAKVRNGADYVLLATPTGLKWCLEKYVDDKGKWIPTATLDDFIDSIRGGKDFGVEISASSNPNDPLPIRDRRFMSYSDFARSGFNLVSKGTMEVRANQGVFAFQS
jgi:hypothetical protein